MNCAANPPPVLSMARVLAYAIVDESIGFSGSQRLYVDGELLGKVPRLALCQPLSRNPTTDVLVFYWLASGQSRLAIAEEISLMLLKAR